MSEAVLDQETHVGDALAATERRVCLTSTYLENTVGRDFIVGDIHGCFDAVRALMQLIEFDEFTDRLFSVGDLVDRGAQSHEAIDWILKPWFFPVRGNHEQMAIDHVADWRNADMYRMNGGSWFLALPAREQADIARVFDTLPYLIQIQTADNGLIGIVHADAVLDDWASLCEVIEHEKVQTVAIWGRTRITANNATPVRNVSAIVCGHTIIESPRELGNVVYIDTGAIAGNALTCVEIRGGALVAHQVQTSGSRSKA